MFCEHSLVADYRHKCLTLDPLASITLGILTLKGSWGSAHQWLFNNFKSYLIIQFSTVNKVCFNATSTEDYYLSFSCPTPGLWCGANHQPLNYSQKPLKALTQFIKLFSWPVKKDNKQWWFASINLPQQYEHYIALSPSETKATASGSSTSTQEAPSSSTVSSSPHSPKFTTSSQSQMDFGTPDIMLCKPVIGTEAKVLLCTTLGCPRSFHENCGLALPNGNSVCTQACLDNVLNTPSE